jgi:hypothetical protein
MPSTHLPTRNCGSVVAEQARVAPIAKMQPPREIVYVREIRSDSGPDATDTIEAAMRMDETNRPCTIGDSPPNWRSNCGITIIGPMLYDDCQTCWSRGGA